MPIASFTKVDKNTMNDLIRETSDNSTNRSDPATLDQSISYCKNLEKAYIIL